MPLPYISSTKNMSRSTALDATAFTARNTGKYECYLTMASMMPLTEIVPPDMSVEWTTKPCARKPLRPFSAGSILTLRNRSSRLFPRPSVEETREASTELPQQKMPRHDIAALRLELNC